MSKWENEVSHRIKRINAQITTVQRIFGSDSQIYRRIVSTIQKAGGKTRFTKKMFVTNDLRQLSKAERALTTIEHSQYLTKAGRAEIGRKARETFAVNHSDYSDKTITQLYDIFKNSSQYKKVGELFSGSSEVLLDAIAEALEEYEDISAQDMQQFLDVFLPYAFGEAKGTREQQLEQVVDMFWDAIESKEK